MTVIEGWKEHPIRVAWLYKSGKFAPTHAGLTSTRLIRISLFARDRASKQDHVIKVKHEGPLFLVFTNESESDVLVEHRSSSSYSTAIKLP